MHPPFCDTMQNMNYGVFFSLYVWFLVFIGKSNLWIILSFLSIKSMIYFTQFDVTDCSQCFLFAEERV